ncbi:MAG: MBL fold metallo-hydrolase [Bacteroidia bacterium]|nr:MBL fold metallo-hydrolase [Bacteroidia bacterium]
MKLYPIRDRNLKLDGGAMFGVVPKVLWNKYYPADENNLCNWAMRCLLVVDNNRKILIDNGIGEKQDEKFFEHYYLNGDFSITKSLSEYGFKPEDITDVILSHLHFDHCGGCTMFNNDKTGIIPSFPNAIYWVSKKQWLWASTPNAREQASFLKENIFPLMEIGKLQLIGDEDIILFPGIRLVQYHGHTDGQIIPHIQYQDKTVVFMADLLPSTAHVPLSWVMSYDIRPLITFEDKKSFYKEALQNNYILFFEHDLYHECCTIHETPKGVRVKETFNLEQYLY